MYLQVVAFNFFSTPIVNVQHLCLIFGKVSMSSQVRYLQRLVAPPFENLSTLSYRFSAAKDLNVDSLFGHVNRMSEEQLSGKPYTEVNRRRHLDDHEQDNVA